jgi:hypothetical protein
VPTLLQVHYDGCCAPTRGIGRLQLPRRYSYGDHRLCMIMKNEWPVILPCLTSVLPLFDHSLISAARLDGLLASLIT